MINFILSDYWNILTSTASPKIVLAQKVTQTLRTARVCSGSKTRSARQMDKTRSIARG